MSKLPAFQFYPSDWRSDNGVQSLSYFERGVWFEILCLMHESEQRGKMLLNGKPMPDDALARLLGLDKQILTKTLTTLLDYGVASRDEEGALISRRMIRDEKLRQIRTEAGKKGGNPNLVNQNPTKTKNEVNQNPTPSSSSSSSNKKQTKNNAAAAASVGSVFEEWKRVLNHPLAVLDAKRTKRIQARFDDGLSAGDLKTAIAGVLKSPYHLGINETGTRYDAIDTIFRDRAQVEKFIELANAPDVQTEPPLTTTNGIDYEEEAQKMRMAESYHKRGLPIPAEYQT